MLNRWFSSICAKSLLFAIAILVSQTTFARKFYVSNSGSDANSFSAAQNSSTPWATLSKVSSSMGSFTSGDSILFAKGSKFTGTLTVQGKTGLFFGSYGSGEKPLFWGTGSLVNNLITLRTSTNITINGWYINDTTISSTDRGILSKIQKAITMESSSFSNTVKNCLIERVGMGVYITGTSGSSLIDSTEIRNLRMIRNDSVRDNDYGATAVQLSGSNNTVTNNFFHGCWANSIDYRFDGGSIEFYVEAASDTIRNNLVAYNTFYDNNGTIEHGALSSSNRSFRNNKVYYNKILNCGSITYINVTGQYAASVKGLDISNNVYVQNVPRRNPSSGQWVMDMSTTVANQDTIIKFRNNVVQSSANMIMISSDFSAQQFIHTNNIYKLSGGSSIGVLPTPTEISTSGVIWVNTSNANPSLWNYNLTSTSPARGAGVNIGLTRDFSNQAVSNPPDIGILQFAGATPPAAPTVTVVSPTSGTFGQVVTLRGTNFVNVSSVVFITGVTVNLPFTVVDSTTIRVTMNLQASQYINAPNGGIFFVTTATGSNTGGSPYFVYTPPPVPQCQFIYGNWSACLGGRETRQYISSPAGCAGTPPADSLSRTCIVPVVSNFTFIDTLATLNLFCNTSGNLKILDSTGRIVITFDYAPGDVVVNVASLAPGNYTATTFGTSLGFSTFVKLKIEYIVNPLCRRSFDGQIDVKGILGVGPYTYSRNSVTNFSNEEGFFPALRRGTYVIRVKDATGRIASLTITLVKRSSTCFVWNVDKIEYCMN